MNQKINVGFVGGGQLGRMLAEACKKLDVSCLAIGEDASSASKYCEMFPPTNEGVNKFLDSIDVFTFESEHEGLELVDQVNEHKIPIRPPSDFVETAGDRFLEKSMLQRLDIPVAPYELLDINLNGNDLEKKINDLFTNNELSTHGIVIKTRHGGYDGKGQWVLTKDKDHDFESLANEISKVIVEPGCIVEGLVDFSIECSILATRAINGDMKVWPLAHNIHEDSILRFSYAPMSDISNVEELSEQALVIAKKICDENNYVGTIGVECFVTENGLVVNEIAPRVHNSGHWTIEGSVTSQFEQHVRAISGLELGSTESKGYSAMINVIGRDIDIDAISALENTYVHWYDKEVKPVRKVGHITVVGLDELDRANKVQLVLALLDQSHS